MGVGGLSVGLAVLLAASIEGRLWNAVTGAPVRKADVMVGTAEGTPVKRAISDGNGRYTVEGLAAGRYRVAAGRAGYLPALSRGVIVLRADEARRDVDFGMEAPAAIEGHVLDHEGEPVEGVRVAVLRREGHRVIRAGEGTTNDRGEYRVAGLLPGSYVVRAGTRAVGEAEVYGPAYYPESAGWEGAVVVTVGRGGEAQGIDVRVAREGSGQLRGVVKTVAGVAGEQVTVRVARKETGELSGAAMEALEETAVAGVVGQAFTIPRLAPGLYRVEVRGEGAGGAVYWALQDVAVGPGGQAEVDLQLARGLELVTRVEPEQKLQMALVRANGMRVEADAKGRFRELTPGMWELEVRGLAAGRYVDGVWLGEKKVNGAMVEVGGKRNGLLRVTVREDGATVEGSAGEEGVAVGFEGAGNVVVSGQEGRFRLEGVRPGKYRLRCGSEVGGEFVVAARSVVKRDCGG